MDDRPITTDELYFRDPDIDPPPRAASLLLLNPGGVLIVGNWTDDCLAWCPKPKIPQSVKNKMAAARKLKNTETTDWK
jgi:hypothetical protein